MKRLAALLVFTLLLCILSACRQPYDASASINLDWYNQDIGTSQYDSGYDAGYKDGRKSMLDDGNYVSVDEAYDAVQKAYNQGYGDGFEEGVEVGGSDGYDDGFKDGYDTGWDDAHDGTPYTPEPH